MLAQAKWRRPFSCRSPARSGFSSCGNYINFMPFLLPLPFPLPARGHCRINLKHKPLVAARSRKTLRCGRRLGTRRLVVELRTLWRPVAAAAAAGPFVQFQTSLPREIAFTPRARRLPFYKPASVLENEESYPVARAGYVLVVSASYICMY